MRSFVSGKSFPGGLYGGHRRSIRFGVRRDRWRLPAASRSTQTLSATPPRARHPAGALPEQSSPPQASGGDGHLGEQARTAGSQSKPHATDSATRRSEDRGRVHTGGKAANPSWKPVSHPRPLRLINDSQQRWKPLFGI
ncbi:MAG: hypothetical protein CW348_05970 [Thermobifida sp.]|nr:hypothetical protein [Thermobifida sp.]PZN64506.1 MAG: hypothetical protein DIU53_05900 [Thermobifida fusca]